MTRRRERVSKLIREELSELLKREVKDPRLGGLVSVTEVVSSHDLRYAKVFVSIMGTEEEKQEALSGLGAAAGFFKRELGQRLTLRYIPELSFERDDSIEQGSRVLQLIDEVTTHSNAEEAPEGVDS